MLLHTIVDIINKKYCNNNAGLSLTFSSFYRANTISQKYEILQKMILDNVFIGKDKPQYMYVFSLHQKITFAINKLKNLYKMKKKYIKSDIDTDLSMEKLTTYKSNQVIDIIENNTIYKFAIVDLLRILNSSLLHSVYLRPSPHHPKNPYTNITFSIHNIYNIYLHTMLHTNYNIKSHILSYFENELNLRSYFESNICLLKSASVKNYISTDETLGLFDYAVDMFQEYWVYTHIRLDMFLRNKRSIVNKIKHLLYYYLLLQHYSLDSEMYNKYKYKLIMSLKDFTIQNPTFGRRIYNLNRRPLSSPFASSSSSSPSLFSTNTVTNTATNTATNTLLLYSTTIFGGLLQDSSYTPLNTILRIPQSEEIIQSQSVINNIPSLEEWVNSQLNHLETNTIISDVSTNTIEISSQDDDLNTIDDTSSNR